MFRVRLPRGVTDKCYAVQLPQKWRKKVLFGREDLCVAKFPPGFADQDEEEVLGTVQLLLTKRNVQELIESGQAAAFGYSFSYLDDADASAPSVDQDRSSSPSYY